MVKLISIALISIWVATALGCSNGDLSRSEAKRKLSKATDMCNPCFIEVEITDPLGLKLVQLGYLDRHPLRITSLGQQTLGANAIPDDLNPGPDMFLIGAFKKEIDEVTGISINQSGSGIAEVKFNYQIVPILDLLRDDPQISVATLSHHPGFDLQRLGIVEQHGGKFIAFHTTGSAQFKKYDDGWRIEHANQFSHHLDLTIWSVGGVPESVVREWK